MARSTKAALQFFHTALFDWYHKHGRHELPWRKTRDPYAIWVSEIMLQQTQVKTVLERFYFPFLKAFPTVKVLAQADLQQVLTLWQGLGYYNRARNLQRAAQEIAGLGNFPDNAEALQKLPGIGQNTAHAIAAFAFHEPVPVMEANVKRVVARIFAMETPSTKQSWEAAFTLLDTQNPFGYNQAMMDLGAMICTPRQPACALCPANNICKGQIEPERYPVKKAAQALPVRQKIYVAFRDTAGRYFLRPREGKFLHGLWEFPEYEVDQAQALFENQSYAFKNMQSLGSFTHDYSHFRLEATLLEQPLLYRGEGEFWKTPEQIAALPL